MTDDRALLTIYRCPTHPTFVSLCVDGGEGIGTRVAGGKCCPRQYSRRLVAWHLTQELRDEIVEEMDAALKQK